MMISIPNLLWFRVLANLMSGAAFFLMGMTAALLAWRRDIGHRALLVLSVLFFGDRSITNLLAAWDLIAGGTRLAFWTHLVSGFLALIYATWIFVSRHDILTTLLTTEEADRRRKDLSRDAEQARINFDYIRTQTLEVSREACREQAQILKREQPCPTRPPTGLLPWSTSLRS